MVERGMLGGLQVGCAEEVGDPAWHVEIPAVSSARATWRSSVCLGIRAATAVRMEPRLTWWTRAMPAMDRPTLEFASGGEGLRQNLKVDGSSPVRRWRAVRSLAENEPSWMRKARRPGWRRPRMCPVLPGRARVSNSLNFGPWTGPGLLEDGRVREPSLVEDEF
ncbi:hypothetical protein ABT275_35355 [Streptomyces sp. NPDC001185]|uniref:hypothetical protein n=1 Tax=Streptomyces sp. NPDC001185 TaxID=3154380 RepID=UPI00332944C9